MICLLWNPPMKPLASPPPTLPRTAAGDPPSPAQIRRRQPADPPSHDRISLLQPTHPTPPSGGARTAPEAPRTACPPLRSIVVGSVRIQLEEDFAHARTSSTRRVSFSTGCRVSHPPTVAITPHHQSATIPGPAADLPPQMLLEVYLSANRPMQSQVQTFMSWFLPNAAGTRRLTALMDWTRRNGPRSA